MCLLQSLHAFAREVELLAGRLNGMDDDRFRNLLVQHSDHVGVGQRLSRRWLIVSWARRQWLRIQLHLASRRRRRGRVTVRNVSDCPARMGLARSAIDAW